MNLRCVVIMLLVVSVKGNPSSCFVPNLDNAVVAIRTYHGRYVAAEQDFTITANREQFGDWEKFKLKAYGGGRYALETYHRRYVVAEGDFTIRADRQGVGAWEQFILEPVDPCTDKYALKTYHGRYVAAETDYTITANRQGVGAWETFRILLTDASPTPLTVSPPVGISSPKCISKVSHISDSWCEQVKCDPIYNQLCEWSNSVTPNPAPSPVSNPITGPSPVFNPTTPGSTKQCGATLGFNGLCTSGTYERYNSMVNELSSYTKTGMTDVALDILQLAEDSLGLSDVEFCFGDYKGSDVLSLNNICKNIPLNPNADYVIASIKTPDYCSPAGASFDPTSRVEFCLAIGTCPGFTMAFAANGKILKCTGLPPMVSLGNIIDNAVLGFSDTGDGLVIPITIWENKQLTQVPLKVNVGLATTVSFGTDTIEILPDWLSISVTGKAGYLSTGQSVVQSTIDSISSTDEGYDIAELKDILKPASFGMEASLSGTINLDLKFQKFPLIQVELAKVGFLALTHADQGRQSGIYMFANVGVAVAISKAVLDFIGSILEEIDEVFGDDAEEFIKDAIDKTIKEIIEQVQGPSENFEFGFMRHDDGNGQLHIKFNIFPLAFSSLKKLPGFDIGDIVIDCDFTNNNIDCKVDLGIPDILGAIGKATKSIKGFWETLRGAFNFDEDKICDEKHRIILREGETCSQQVTGTLHVPRLGESYRVKTITGVDKLIYGSGCPENDEASSLNLVGPIMKNTVIELFSSPEGDCSESYTYIRIKEDIPYNTQLCINSFESELQCAEDSSQCFYELLRGGESGQIKGKASVFEVHAPSKEDFSPVAGKCTGRDSSTGFDEVIQTLRNNEDELNNKVFISYDATGTRLLPSSTYNANDFINALEIMHENSIGNLEFYFGDSSDGNAVNYGLMNIAAFLAQAMHETIRYDACDENNWKFRQVTSDLRIYPLSNSCGQLGQNYQNYQCKDSEREMQCEVDPNMEITGRTNAKWWGAPPPMYCGPKAKYPTTGYWNPYELCPSGNCNRYPGQQGGLEKNDNTAWATNDIGRTDVEGCCWWGRGIIQTTGICNYGKMNYFLGKKAADRGVDAAFPGINFCKKPDSVCDPAHPTLKYIAGLFYWMEAVQEYSNGGWNYLEKLKTAVQNPSERQNFIYGVSGIVNRGCHNPPNCGTGELDGGEKRFGNYQTVESILL